MDIDKLRLTPEELEAASDAAYVYRTSTQQETADAQLAKALWGIQQQLREKYMDYCSIDLEYALNQAGIPKPEESPMKHE